MSDTEYQRQLLDVVRLAIGMRRLQRVYFRSIQGTDERKRALADALVAEKMFDAAVAKLKAPSLDLGGKS
jgi:hypothetical protein